MSKTTLPKELEQEFNEMFPHGIFELPEFCETVTGISKRGDTYVGMAINKDTLKNFIATAVAQAEERVKQQVLELIGEDEEENVPGKKVYLFSRNELRQQLREKVSSL